MHKSGERGNRIKKSGVAKTVSFIEKLEEVNE